MRPARSGGGGGGGSADGPRVRLQAAEPLHRRVGRRSRSLRTSFFSFPVPPAGKNLQAQYERWQPRAKYKMHLDPTTEDVKKLAISCRRTAKGERVLFHYNGHGVPRPTANGEVWVFNKSYTQYIPLSIYDLQTWVGTPAIYVFDCSVAGQILSSFKQFMVQRQHEAEGFAPGGTPPQGGYGELAGDAMKDCILLCACAENELLPQTPDLPADVFTSCLTTPIKVALRWFCSRSLLRHEGVTKELIDRIPGKQTDRKSPLGELNWIFTAITDTIAWNVLPRALFQKLFRQDLLVASLFRNFLLAERIMRAANCTPVSHPRLPPTHQHPMWQAWDMAAEMCLLQLPDLVSGDSGKEYQPSPFFSEQLTAFELWLEHGSPDKRPPEQLPIVLQVLLSQVHRLRALVLLGRFLDMGPWAVDLALSGRQLWWSLGLSLVGITHALGANLHRSACCSRDFPVRPEAAADHRARPAPDVGLHLDQNHSVGCQQPGPERPHQGRRPPVLHQAPGVAGRGGRAGVEGAGSLRPGRDLQRPPQGAAAVRAVRLAAGVLCPAAGCAHGNGRRRAKRPCRGAGDGAAGKVAGPVRGQALRGHARGHGYGDARADARYAGQAARRQRPRDPRRCCVRAECAHPGKRKRPASKS